MSTTPKFLIKDTVEDTLIQWARELNHLVNNLDNDTGYINTAVTDEAIDDLSGTVTTHTTQISQNAEQIALKASAETVNALDERVTSAEAEISVQAGEIALKASQSSVDSLSGTVSSHTSLIQQNADQILLKVSEGTIGGANLLKDSGFTFGGGAWTASGSGIVFTDTGRTEGVCCTIPGALATTKYINQLVSLANSISKYVVSCYMKTVGVEAGTTNPFVCLYAEVIDGGGTAHYYNSDGAYGTTAWTRYSFEIGPWGWANPTIASIRVFGYARDFTGTVYFDDFQIEEGESLTAWKPNANELKSSGMTITGEDVTIRSGKVNIEITDPSDSEVVKASMNADADGFEFDKVYIGELESPSIKPVYNGASTVYVGDGGSYPSFRAFFAEHKQYHFPYEVALYYSASDTNEWKNEGRITVEGLSGYPIHINTNGKQVRGYLYLRGNCNSIFLDYGLWTCPSGIDIGEIISAYSNPGAIVLTGVTLDGGYTGGTGADKGFLAYCCPTCVLDSVEIYRTKGGVCVYATYSRISANATKGYGSSASFQAYRGGIITLGGTRINGSLVEVYDGDVVDSSTGVDNGSAPDAPPSETTITRTCTLRTFRNGGWRTDGNAATQAIQGDWSDYGNNLGHFFFDSALPSGTVQSATLTVTRAAGGYSAGRSPRIGSSDRTSASGTPTISNLSDEALVAIGATVALDVKEQVQAIMGTSQSLAMYITSSLADRYMRISSASLSVTYS